jgi:hypothetical protein
MTTDAFNRGFGAFVRGFVACGFWVSNADEEGKEMLDKYFDISDLHPDSKELIKADCEKFYTENYDLLIQAKNDFSCHGHDFWLTRCGHGAGFWDRGYETIGDQLTEKTEEYPECYLYIGDDGKIHYSAG